jgi:hypothetical protein
MNNAVQNQRELFTLLDEIFRHDPHSVNSLRLRVKEERSGESVAAWRQRNTVADTLDSGSTRSPFRIPIATEDLYNDCIAIDLL